MAIESIEHRPYTVRVSQPSTLAEQLHRLEATLQDMQNTNPNIRPIKWNTKQRWVDDLLQVYQYFNQFLPKDQPAKEDA